MSNQETFALVLFLGWFALMALAVILTELDRHRRGKDTFDWVKRLYKRLYKESDK